MERAAILVSLLASIACGCAFDLDALRAGRGSDASSEASQPDAGPRSDVGAPVDAYGSDGGVADGSDGGCTTDTGPCMAGLISGLGGPAGFGPNAVGSSDDGASTAIPLISPLSPNGLDFYGYFYDSLYVNNNGNVTFRVAQANFGGGPLAMATTAAMIAPLFSDVDTRSGGQPARNNVDWFTDGHRVVVTWDHVSYFAMHDNLQNSYQLVITDRGDVAQGDFDLELRYAQCSWTTGDASGGTGGFGGFPARAGFAAGDGSRGFELPGSGTMSVLDLCTTSNVGVPGVWRYAFRSGNPT